ncbi:hypothetical protein [Poseidonibacter ostreae]|uniref:Uncharacterized protein n=1 Tax=Poseidonibacter ostreae TaxID=2654171 RepID=A0A6L4WX00_9BACT|nr:hypothetical protein [Poseidonibacter ostreae]KAB7891273.1 hypothetical protein GBG19_00120 [Poseidonibacter ostreae]
MVCPRSAIIATFLYLDRVEKEGKLNLKSDSDIKKIISEVEVSLDKYISDVKKFDNSIKDLPHNDVPVFHIASKHSIGGANFIKEKGVQTIKDNDKTFEVQTSHKISPTLDSAVIQNGEIEKQLKERMANNISLPDDETVYIGVSKARDVSHKLENGIMNFLSEYNLREMFDLNEIDSLTDIIQKLSVTEIVNPYISSGSHKVKELALEFSEAKLDGIITAIESSPLNSIIITANLDVPIMLESMKDTINLKYRTDLLDLINTKSMSFSKFKEEINYKYKTEDNMDFIDAVSVAKNLELNIAFKPLSHDMGILFTKKDKEEGELLRYAHIVSKKEVLNEKLNEKILVESIPKEVNIDLSGTLSVHLDYDNDKVDLAKISSERTDRPYFYHSNLADGRIPILIIDESDTAPNGSSATVMREIAKKATNIVAGTGTGITGTARSIVSQLANSGTIDNIEELEKRFTELCGVFEIKSPFFKILYRAMNLDKGYRESFKRCLSDIANIKKNSKDASNISKRLEEYTKEVLGNFKNNDVLAPALENLNYFDAVKGSNKIFNGILNDKEFFNANYMHDGKKIFENFVFSLRSDIVKEVAGVQAGMLASLIMSQKDSSISITTREGLTGKKENMNFIDLEAQQEVKEKIFTNELEDEQLDVNVLAPKLISEYFNKKAELNYTAQVFTVLRNNFDSFVDAYRQSDKVGKSNLKILTDASDMTPKDFIYNTSKSGKSTTDDIKSLYVEYLKNNGALLPKTKAGLTDESLKAFEVALEVFEDYVINVHVLAKETNNEKSYIMNYFAPENMYSLFGENKATKEILTTENAFPINLDTNKPYVFSVPIVFMKDSWKDFCENPISYTASMINTEITDILDNFTSKGKEELIQNSIFKNEKPVIVSSRVATSIMNLYDTVAIASKRPQSNEKFIVLAVSTAETNRAIDKIDKEFLQKHNIEVVSVDSTKVAVEVAKANSKKLQFSVNSNYIPISRGLSLAESDDIIVTDNIDRKADAIQLLARGMNPSKNILDSDIQMFNGGNTFDVSINFSEEISKVHDFISNVEEKLEFTHDGTMVLNDTNLELESYGKDMIRSKDTLNTKPTYSSLINEEIHRSNEVYKGFTSGKMSDTKDTEINKFFEASKTYEHVIESNNQDQEEENNIDFM